MGIAELHTTENLKRALLDGQLDWNAARQDIINDFDRALTASEREALLGLYNCLMDAVETTIDPESLDELRNLRAREYRFLLIKEAAIGNTDGVLNPAKMAALTKREVDAGRLNVDDGLHKLAVSADFVLSPPKAPVGIVSKLRSWFGS